MTFLCLLIQAIKSLLRRLARQTAAMINRTSIMYQARIHLHQ